MRNCELRLLVPERGYGVGHTVEGAEEVGLDRGSWGPLPEHRRGVEGEVETGVPDVAVEDPPVDAGLTRERYAGRCGNLGVLPLSERAEEPDVVEQGPVDEPADGERLSLSQLDHLLS